jgi:hypothetical protein
MGELHCSERPGMEARAGLSCEAGPRKKVLPFSIAQAIENEGTEKPRFSRSRGGKFRGRNFSMSL